VQPDSKLGGVPEKPLDAAWLPGGGSGRTYTDATRTGLIESGLESIPGLPNLLALGSDVDRSSVNVEVLGDSVGEILACELERRGRMGPPFKQRPLAIELLPGAPR
jgi:hypothetical protein